MSGSDTAADDSTRSAQEMYERSLKALRQDIGCTPERLMLHPELLNALQRRLDQQGKPRTATGYADELRDAITSLSNPKHRDTLLVALRLDPDYQQTTLTARREHFNKNLRQSPDPEVRTQVVDNLRTLERRENDAIEAVTRLLAEPYGILNSEGKPLSKVSQENQITAGQPRLISTSTASTYYFSEAGSLERNDVYVDLVATGSSPLRKFNTWRRYFSDLRPGTLAIEALYGCVITSTREDNYGGVMAEVEVFEDLQPGDEPYPCAYRILVKSSIRSVPVVDFQATSSGSATRDIRLVFNAAAVPQRAWWYDSDNDVAGRIEPNREEKRHLDLLDGGKYIHKRFNMARLAQRLHHGIAWIWSE